MTGAIMPETITIDPVTRIEGHAKITIHLDEKGQVADARFHVTQFRGFEKITEGRPFYEMPALTARICGICPVSHMMASAKAGDALLAVQIPETAADLRQIMNLAQVIQSHALSFFYLSSPDFVMGFDADPSQRSIFGVIDTFPELAKDGIALRKSGQSIIELLGGEAHTSSLGGSRRRQQTSDGSASYRHHDGNRSDARAYPADTGVVQECM